MSGELRYAVAGSIVFLRWSGFLRESSDQISGRRRITASGALYALRRLSQPPDAVSLRCFLHGITLFQDALADNGEGSPSPGNAAPGSPARRETRQDARIRRPCSKSAAISDAPRVARRTTARRPTR